MRLTFLGHQGWLVESADYRLLVDPIVTPYFRNSDFSKAWIYPPRRLDLQRLGRIDGVYFSHEHEDHFHIESIHALDRATTLYLSGNMSAAAERILHEMGFGSVVRLYATDEVALGSELTLKLFPPPAAVSERWVLQPFLRGRSWLDSFFNMVDCPVSPEFLEWLRRQRAPGLGLVCVANNQQAQRASRDPCDLKPPPKKLGATLGPARVLTSHLSMSELPELRYLAIVGGGFLEGTNPAGTFLCARQDRLAEILFEYSHGETKILGPDPGDQIVLSEPIPTVTKRGHDSFVVDSPEGSEALRRAEAVARAYVPERDFSPVTAQNQLTLPEREELAARLAEFGVRMSAHPFHWELMQQGYVSGPDGLPVPCGDGRFLLALRCDGAPGGVEAYEYQPIRQAFVPVEGLLLDDAIAMYPYGFECWASDLLMLMRGHLSVFELIKHRQRHWGPERAYFGKLHFGTVLEQLFSPEVAGSVTYTLYRCAYERLIADPSPSSAAEASEGVLQAAVLAPPKI